MATTEKHSDSSYDVVIIGAGISGINAAYRAQQGLPHLSYTILEARDVIGGTWSFFKYPGMRSDSEIAGFAFPWAPWDTDKTIADAPSILRYLESTAAKYGIDKKIQFNTKVTHLDWHSDQQKWRVTTVVNGQETHVIHARFMIMSTGYYDYSAGQEAAIPGIENFSGVTVHPQFWPADLDYTDKNVVIVGSGATAVTLLPSLSKTAKHVTMLQRSPSFFLVMPTIEKMDNVARKLFPTNFAYALIRLRVLILEFLFIRFCALFPKAAGKLLRAGVKDELPPDHPLDPHFNPRYNPFEQRLCITPDGDFFQAIRDHKAHVETGEVETIDGKTIVLRSGQRIEDVDMIVTATGLKLYMIGGIQASIDGVPLDISTKFLWRTTCLQDVPNMCFIIGYVDHAWTLGSDSSARIFVRLIKKVEKTKSSSFVATMSGKEAKNLVEVPLVAQSSGYFQRRKHILPRAAKTAPWNPRWHYFKDYWLAGYGNLSKGMKMVKAPTANA